MMNRHRVKAGKQAQGRGRQAGRMILEELFSFALFFPSERSKLITKQ